MKKLILIVIIGYTVLALAFVVIFFGTKQKREQEGAPGGLNPNAQVSLKSEGEMALEALEGEEASDQEAFYANGNKSVEWWSEVTNDQFRAYYPDGEVWLEVGLMQGRLEGYLKCYYPDGTLLSEQIISMSRLQGRDRRYYADGTPWVELIYKDSTLITAPLLQGQPAQALDESGSQGASYFKAYGEDGALRVQWDATTVKNQGQVNFASGELSSTWSENAETKEGTLELFHPNGEVWSKAFFRDNLPQDVIQQKYDTGKLWNLMAFSSDGTIALVEARYPGGGPWFVIGRRALRGYAPPEIYSESN